MRRILPLVLLVLLAFSVYSQSTAIDEPALITSVDAVVTKTGTVRAVGGTLSYVELNLSAPIRSGWQLPAYSVQTASDSEGNTFSILKDSHPANPFSYSVSTQVLTKARVTDSLPPSYQVPEDVKAYLKPESGPYSQKITLLAKKIIENASDDFERAALIAIWVHENIQYDESLSGKQMDAEWVLANRRGVCTEYTSLFIALARSVGIPARYSSGYSYTSTKGWLGHAWAEVYLGEWVPVDPTWMEAGHLDATHIHMFTSAGRKAETSVFAYMSPGARLDWSGSGTIGSNAKEVELRDSQAMPRNSDYELKTGAGTIGFGGETVVYAKLKYNDYRVVDFNLLSCIGESSLEVEEPQRYSAMEPGEERLIVWRIKAPSSLKPNYVYTCPMVLNSAYLSAKKASVSMQDKVKGASLDAWLEKSSVLVGEEQTVYFSSASHPSDAKITVIAGDRVYAYSAKSETQTIQLSPSSLGTETVWVFSNYGGVKKLSYEVKGSRSIILGAISIPKRLMEGGGMNVSFTVVNNGTQPQRVGARAVYGSEERSSYAVVSDKQEFDFEFSNLTAGTGVLTVAVEGQDDSFEKKTEISVMPKPWVSMQMIFSGGGNLTNVTFLASASGEAKNIRVYLDGKILPLSGGSGTTAVEPGNYRMKVVWYDAYGQEYSFEKELVVPRKTTGRAGAEQQTGICPGFFIILLVLFSARRRIN